MDVGALLLEAHGRIAEHVDEVLDELDPALLVARPDLGTNHIGWLLWHLTRVEDAHVAEVLGEPQVWETGGHAEGFGLPADPTNSGYGHGPDDVAAVRPADAQVLRDYHGAVAARTAEQLRKWNAEDLDRIVDEGWDPPVTLGVRLVSVLDDAAQHAGQAKFLRGLLERS